MALVGFGDFTESRCISLDIGDQTNIVVGWQLWQSLLAQLTQRADRLRSWHCHPSSHSQRQISFFFVRYDRLPLLPFRWKISDVTPRVGGGSKFLEQL